MTELDPNAFRMLINRCLGELRDWTEHHPEAQRTPEEVYARVARLLRDARRIETLPELDARLRELESFIASEGPLSDAFLPSLEKLHERVSQSGV